MAKNVYRQGKKAVSISASGALNIRLGPVRLTGSRLEVKLESGRAIHPLRGAQLSPPVPNDYLPGGGVRLFARSQQSGLEITVNFVLPAESPYLGISVELKNLQRAVIPLQSVTLVRLPLRKIFPIGSAPKPYMLIESGHASRPTGMHALSGEPAVDEIPHDVGQTMTALFAPGGNCLLAGCLLGGRTLTGCKIDRDQLVITADIRGEIPPHGYFETDLLILGGEDEIVDALRRFATTHAGRKRSVEASGYHAWSSCDWYADELAESDIMDNLEFLKETPWLRDNLKYVVVGRGWQRAYGDWEPSDRFPSLMDTVATRIRDAGFTPGIWVAPLMAAPASPFAQGHPEWVLKRVDKKDDDVPRLDFTIPEVRDAVYATIRKLYTWGYRYFTTDFSGATLEPETYRYRGRAGSVQDHFSALLTAIRAAAGEDSFWLAQDIPLSPCAGLCDAVAVSGRARPFYSTLLGCARSGMFRAHFHGQAWLNDPGTLLVRGPETASPDAMRPGDARGGPYERYGWEKGPMLRLAEARLWATWIIASGGTLTLGDRLKSLKAEGLAIIKKVLLRAGNFPATPLDLGVVPLPRIWQRIEGQTALLALFNWSEEENEVVVTERHGMTLPADGELFEVWREETVKVLGGTLRRRLPPRSCELLEWDLE